MPFHSKTTYLPMTQSTIRRGCFCILWKASKVGPPRQTVPCRCQARHSLPSLPAATTSYMQPKCAINVPACLALALTYAPAQRGMSRTRKGRVSCIYVPQGSLDHAGEPTTKKKASSSGSFGSNAGSGETLPYSWNSMLQKCVDAMTAVWKRRKGDRRERNSK